MNYFLWRKPTFFRRINEAGRLRYGNGIHGFRHASDRAMHAAMWTPTAPYHRAGLHRNRVWYTIPCVICPEEKRGVAADISKALSFVRKMKKSLPSPSATTSPHPYILRQHDRNPASPLQWTGNAIDLVELIYGINEMGCINNGNMPLKQLAPLL